MLPRLQRFLPWLAMPTNNPSAALDIFGGTKPWISPRTTWHTVDDRIRGGSSHSYLEPISASSSQQVRFFGQLDTTTLGGAGFASQTTIAAVPWDLHAYAGLELALVRGDEKLYTLVLKDAKREEQRDDDRERASVSWEYDFRGTAAATTPPSGSAVASGEVDGEERQELRVVRVRWDKFRPTYRGREKKDAGSLKTSEISSFGLMMRSFFDQQQGDFEIVIASISAFKD